MGEHTKPGKLNPKNSSKNPHLGIKHATQVALNPAPAPSTAISHTTPYTSCVASPQNSARLSQPPCRYHYQPIPAPSSSLEAFRKNEQYRKLSTGLATTSQHPPQWRASKLLETTGGGALLNQTRENFGAELSPLET